MKKNYILLGSLLLCISALQAISDQDIAKNDIVKKITAVYANLFGPSKYLFDKSIITIQNQNINAWNSAISDAKAFVIENSKNLVGVKDSDLINAINKVEKASMDLMNAVKISRGSTKGQDAIFSRIEKEMTKLGDDIKKKSFNLANKKNAQWVIESAAIYTASGANRAYKDAMNPAMPTDLPPTLR